MKAEDMINWGKLSRFLAGSRQTVRKNSVPKIHQQFVDDLLKAMNKVISKRLDKAEAGVFWTDNLTMAKWFAIPAVVVELPQSNMFECDTCHEDYEPDESGICPHCGSLTTTAAAKLRCRLKRRNL